MDSEKGGDVAVAEDGNANSFCVITDFCLVSSAKWRTNEGCVFLRVLLVHFLQACFATHPIFFCRTNHKGE